MKATMKPRISRKRNNAYNTPLSVAVALMTMPFGIWSVHAEGSNKPVPVNVENFVRAETSAQFDRVLDMTEGINKFVHLRGPTPLDKQNVIRMNRDTLYSAAIVDISKGATLIVPDAGERYMSIMVVNEDHYINKVIHKPGRHRLTVKEYGTPFVNLSVRTLVNASDPDDIAKANALQNQLKIEAKSAKPYTHPVYDERSFKETYDALLVLGKGMPDASATFGKKKNVDSIRHLLGTAWGWGGLPDEEAYYLNVEPNLPVGAYQLTVKDVPVDAFWSVSMYNKDGYFEPNKEESYSVNNLTGTPNEDGSFTIHFGGDPENLNHLPITEGWNYTVRFYQPRKKILDGSWIFPKIEPLK
ncbi:hypothetical protein PDESU_04008 [Pontiella desulfatans]|uniref:DUF1214 domain-containing protein n=1 Tax=Pontiella desulfatans TaxID=2750659 RepID=A0A6C2U675_PONDE|nr:DUF1214 domain-containing protein [Pontiella desulfatans]VGO15425.1 hypothetical protein PDESU_04008 [Pontiella desulfatans]